MMMTILKPGRNDPCPCGSKNKYKKCCQGKSGLSPPPREPIEAVEPSASECSQLVALFNGGYHVELENRTRLLIGQYPDSGFVWTVLGATLRAQGKNALSAMAKAVTLMPDDATAHSNMGTALRDHGQLDDAVESFRKALEIRPVDAEAQNNLGVALMELGRLDEAVAGFHRALGIKPDYAETHNNMGNALRDLNRLDDAVESYRLALAIKPDYVEARSNLGVALKDLGRLNEAVACFRRVLVIKPDYADVHSNLGVALKDLGQLNEAVTSFRRALEINPDFAAAHSNLGVALKDLGQPNEALTSIHRALEIKPDSPEMHGNLGNTLRDLGHLNEAMASFRRALEIKPGDAEAHSNLGNARRDLGQLNEAVASYRQALEIKPDYAEAHSNLGNALRDLGQLKQAVASYRRALAIKPDCAEVHSNLLFALRDDFNQTPRSFLAEASKYGQVVSARRAEFFAFPHLTERPNRLRVGFVSGDLRNHPIGYFLENFLANIDPLRIELIAFPSQYKADEVTERLRQHCSEWKPLVGLNDQDAARLIFSNAVHVLLDLSGHTAHNRLPVFALKPAPVQATWLGFMATTGVSEIDYILGDPLATPSEHAGQYSEKIWRLPDIYGCLTPPSFDVPVGLLPALSTSGVTFGCFNNLAKMNDHVVALWARVLHAVKGSRLFLKSKQLSDPGVCVATLERYVSHGIEPHRLILEGSSPRAELLATYNRVDIALDPFPYTGGTTNFEALLMGVPFITLQGASLLSRCGSSIANCAGLGDWIAYDGDDYVAKAKGHAANLDGLSALRKRLRQEVPASPLFDAKRFALNFEKALWKMWGKWSDHAPAARENLPGHAER